MVDSGIVKIGETEQIFGLTAKTFSTGSKGYWGGGKMEANGKRYQVQVQAVEIGSKPQKK